MKLNPLKLSSIIITPLLLVLSLNSMAQAKVPREPRVPRPSRPEYVASELLVKFKGERRFRVIRLPASQSIHEAIAKHIRNPEVEYAEPNYIARTFMVPNDPYYSYQWHLDNPTSGGINAEAAWETSQGSNVVIAVIDTGIAYENYRKSWRKRYYQAPDLAGTCFVAGHDFVENDTHPNDDNSHGTHVAGTAAQSTNNGIGVAGVAFEACLMPIKVLDKKGEGTYADIADGIRWAADNGAHIINLSLGGPAYSEALKEAVAYAYDQGVTLIAAAGNEGDGENPPMYPAAYDQFVIAVGATRYDENRAYYSNTGSYLDLVAPGGDLTIDQNGDGYADGVLQNTFNPNSKRTNDFGYYFFQGTSMGAPHVAGVGALVIANGTASTPAEVRAALETTTKDLGAQGWDEIYGWGLVDAYAAINYTAASECAADADCDDGLYCNGTETCLAGTCQTGTAVSCDDGNSCTSDTCDEASQSCQNTAATDGTSCEDELYCNGVETCQAGICTAGTAVDCVDGVACTVDSCDETNDLCLNTPNDSSCDDGLYCNGAEICDGLLDCQPGPPVDCNEGSECTTGTCNEDADTCEYNNVADNAACSGGICCSGTCGAPVCAADVDCDDANACTVDSCSVAGTCSASCSYAEVTECVNNDSCCPASCAAETDNDCVAGELCWSGDYQYLYRNRSQAAKFCKCTTGTHGYNSYNYTWGRGAVYQYTDSGDNENWEVDSRSSRLPVYEVICTDGATYPTNQSYDYPSE